MRVRLENEFMCRLPLWNERGGTGPADWPMLSPGLVQALMSWHDYFDVNFDLKRGWIGGSKTRYREHGMRLEKELQQELGEDYEVTLNPWPA